MDAIDIFALICVLYRFIILIPSMLYGLQVFRQHKSDHIFGHRNTLLIYLITIIAIMTISIERTFLISVFVWQIIHVHVWVVYLIMSIFWWALYALFAIKAYNLYYTQQYNLSIADDVWKREINPNTVDWYITNKNKWGSVIWLSKLCLIPYIISCSGDIILPQIFGEGPPVDWFHSMSAFLPINVAFIVVYKARKLSDTWNIRDEVLYQAVLALIALFFYTIAFCIGAISSLQHQYGVDLYRFNWTIYSFFGDFVIISFGVIPTFYPMILVKKRRQLHSMLMSRDDINMSLSSLNAIMSKYNSFQLFMKHLVSELCAENALFLVELVQIKHEYQKRNNYKVKIVYNDETLLINFNINPFNTNQPYKSDQDLYFTYLLDESGSISHKICIPMEVPKSLILTKNENNLSKQMYCLYHKYVEENQLNLSYNARHKLDEIFIENNNNNNNDEILFNAMDGCGKEILMLLHRSFSRFISKETFATILKDIKKDTNAKRLKDFEVKKIINSDAASIVTNITK